ERRSSVLIGPSGRAFLRGRAPAFLWATGGGVTAFEGAPVSRRLARPPRVRTCRIGARGWDWDVASRNGQSLRPSRSSLLIAPGGLSALPVPSSITTVARISSHSLSWRFFAYSPTS